MNQETKDAIQQAKEIQEIKEEIRGKYEIEFPEVWTEPIWSGRSKEEMTLIPDKKAVLGGFQEETMYYSVVSEKYKVVSHEEGLHRLEEALLKMKEYGELEIRPTMWKRGGAMKVEVTFPEINLEVKPGDQLQPKVILKNSYDTTQAFSVSFGALQMVCSNGLYAFMIQAALKRKHMQSLDVSDIVKNISVGMERFSEQVGLWSDWTHKQLSNDEWGVIYEELPFTDKQKENILALPIQGDVDNTLNNMILKGSVNKWEAHNAVTQFLTHHVPESVNREDKSVSVGRTFHRH